MMELIENEFIALVNFALTIMVAIFALVVGMFATREKKMPTIIFMIIIVVFTIIQYKFNLMD